MPRLLLVKLGAIGDVIMAIPAAASMHAQGWEIDWVCGEVVAPILRLYPWINVLPVDERRLLRGGQTGRIRLMLALWGQLRDRSHDTIATLYYDRRYRLLTWPVRAARKVWLSETERSARLLPGRHHTDEFARILSGRRDDQTPQQLAPVLPPGLAGLPRPPASGRSRVVLVPGGARNMLRDDALRRWPLENYVEMARLLIEAGYEVVLAGGPEDDWVLAAFAGLPVQSFVGKFSLVDTLGLLDSAEVTVTHDTGPLHLAGITRTSIAAIFGPTDPYGRLPQRANCVAFWGGEGFACRPCYDGRDYAPCTNNGCVQQVTPAMVAAEVQALLTARGEGRSDPPRVILPMRTPVANATDTLINLAGARL